MGDRRRTHCKVCGGHRDDVGEISWAGNCIECALSKSRRVVLSLHKHQGLDFATWRHAHAAAVGAIFPHDELLPGLPQLTARQQANTRHSGKWRRMSDARLAYAGGKCEVRLPGCVEDATAVHLNPALGGNHKLARLDDCRAVCVVCHGYIHAKVSPAKTIALLDGKDTEDVASGQ